MGRVPPLGLCESSPFLGVLVCPHFADENTGSQVPETCPGLHEWVPELSLKHRLVWPQSPRF